MKPTREQVESWRNEWHALKDAQSTPITYIAQRAAEWAAAQSAERISDLESANAKQAARIAELEDEREKREKLEPVFKDVDVDWLYSVLRYAEKNPDQFMGVEDGKYELEGSDAITIAKLYTRPVPARTLTDEVMREIHSRLPITYTYDQLMLATQAWLKGGE